MLSTPHVLNRGVTPPAAPPPKPKRDEEDAGWPVFFVAKPGDGRNPLDAGQLWPWQGRRSS